MTDPQQPGWDPTWQRPDQTQPGQPASEPPTYPSPAIEPQYGQPQYAQPQYPPTEYQQAQYPQAQYPQGQYPQAQYQQYPPAQYAQPQYAQPAYVVRPTNSLAIAALVCSLAGLAVGISAPVGAILGHKARKQIAQTGEQGDGMALAGIIVGWVVTGLFVCGCAAYLGLFATLLASGSVNS